MEKHRLWLVVLLELLLFLSFSHGVNAQGKIYIFHNNFSFEIQNPSQQIREGICTVENEWVEKDYPPGQHIDRSSRQCPHCRKHMCSAHGPFFSHCPNKSCKKELSPDSFFSPGGGHSHDVDHSEVKCSKCDEVIKASEIEKHTETHLSEMETEVSERGTSPVPDSISAPATASSTTSSTTELLPDPFTPAYIQQYTCTTPTASSNTPSSTPRKRVRTLTAYSECTVCQEGWNTSTSENSTRNPALVMHIASCSNRLRLCDRCESLIRAADLDTHNDIYCPRIINSKGIAEATTVSSLRDNVSGANNCLFAQLDRQDRRIDDQSRRLDNHDKSLEDTQLRLESLRNTKSTTLQLLEQFDSENPGKLKNLLKIFMHPGLNLLLNNIPALLEIVKGQTAQASIPAPQNQSLLSAATTSPLVQSQMLKLNQSNETLKSSSSYADAENQRFQCASDLVDPTEHYIIKVTNQVHLISLLSFIKPLSDSDQSWEYDPDICLRKHKDRIFLRKIGSESPKSDIAILIKIPHPNGNFDFHTSPSFQITNNKIVSDHILSKTIAVSMTLLEDNNFRIQIHVDNNEILWGNADKLIGKMGFLTKTGTIEQPSFESLETSSFTNLDYPEESTASLRGDSIEWEKRPLLAAFTLPKTDLEDTYIDSHNLFVIQSGSDCFLVFVMGFMMADDAVTGLNCDLRSKYYEPSSAQQHAKPEIPTPDLPPAKRAANGHN